MAQVPITPRPPANEAPLREDGQHTHAWIAYHDGVADRLRDLPGQLTVGVVDASDAPAGQIGEFLQASSSGTVGLANGTVTDIATLPLTAGDWSVEGNVVFNPTGTVTYAQATVNVVSATSGSIVTRVAGATAATQLRLGTGGAVRINVTTPVTAYLVAQCGFTSGSVSADGIIWARRCR
jgi:hypothetical protein